MALPLALGVGLTVGVAPRTNRIFYDEQIYQNVGQNLADLQPRADVQRRHGRATAGCAARSRNTTSSRTPIRICSAWPIARLGVGTASAFVVNAVAMASDRLLRLPARR